jgi:hypothetical protein
MAVGFPVSRDRDKDVLLLVVGEEEDKDQETAAAAARVVLRGLVAGLGQSSAGWPETSAFIPIRQKLGGCGISPPT